MTSNALYGKLREVITLPLATRLRQLSSAISIEHGNIYFDYLDQKTLELSSHKKIVTLLIDEVYMAQRVEYSNGFFVRFTDNGFHFYGAICVWQLQRCCLCGAYQQT